MGSGSSLVSTTRAARSPIAPFLEAELVIDRLFLPKTPEEAAEE
jgi:hypothetical protein